MKKKNLLLLFMIMFVCALALPANVHADVTCTAIPDAVIDDSIPDLTHTIILVIQIAVPILLVVYGMLDLMKGVMAQKEDEIKKGQQTFVKRAVAAILVFFVVAIVKFLIGLVAKGDGGIIDCANCFISGSSSSSCSPVGTGEEIN